MVAAATFAAALTIPTPALAHCDGLDGPVVAAAKNALQSGNPNPVLIWVQPADEPEIKRAFAEAERVRKLGPEAREMADRYFFETLVRIHRAGEGAPYTGLKPAGRDLGPAIPLADNAVATGSARELSAFAVKEVERGIAEKFADLQKKRSFQPDEVTAGRAYIASYVTFVHYVEGIHQAVEAGAAGHYSEGLPAPAEHHQ
ncbi:hypothetical protein H9L13_09530 [Sphingomonas lutea]|uniref:Peptidoglycan-binding protein n=1 Tax=Sphingomonas lutea TaxID=1045317 RepID=A0A7G9SGB6_9SPHN|nr:DUF6448 family protein [Sphingomonas lutea]QNN66891.1 hypothetical protein H9L13_09530 [Sphingomonas lutea]